VAGRPGDVVPRARDVRGRAGARILYAEPAGTFAAALGEMGRALAERARDSGFTRMDTCDTLHATLLKPNCVGAGRTFNAAPLIAGCDPVRLPPIMCSELRLVRRGEYDENNFYASERRYDVYALPAQD